MTFKDFENSKSNDEYDGSYKILGDSVMHRNFIHYCNFVEVYVN
jgi:hypothetical protein